MLNPKIGGVCNNMIHFCQEVDIVIDKQVIMNIKYYMKYIALIAILLVCIHGDRRIVSRPIESTYNQYGRVDGLTIQWKCYETIYEYDYVKVTLPEPIHDASLTIRFSLQTAYSKNIIILQQSLVYVGANTYYLPMQNNLTADVWYQLKIYLTKPLTISYGLLQLSVVSKPTVPYINYAWNSGFQYYHLQQNSTPSLGILSLNINSSINTAAGSRYDVLLQLQSDISINEQVLVTIDFVDYALTTTITTSTTASGYDKGFMFVGSCSTKCDYDDTYHTCIHQEKCEATPTAVLLTLPYMNANQIYLVEVYVVNPAYVSNVGLEAYWKDNDGKTGGLAFASDQLEVLPIAISAEEIRLLWDIPYNTVVNQMKLGLFVNDPAQKHQSLSSFDIGFSVSATTPIQDQYEVKITVGASSVLESSINHNLPSFRSTTKISCRYVKPDIICTNVDAFVLKNYRYYVRARGYFTTTDPLTSFGNVGIASLSQPNYLFLNLVRGLGVLPVVNADYHDYGGLHQGTSNFRIQQTIVSSHNDTLLPNSTTKSIDDFLYSSNGLVGVDPSITPLQLLFFMKVNLNQMSRPSPASLGQNYTMKIFTNPNIMNTSNLGIDFVSYSSVAKAWDVIHAPCYVDSSNTPTTQQYMCQKYNDHVYGRQVDNTYTKTAKYGLYTSVCGAGQLVTCPSGDCSNACRILRGGFSSGAMTTGSAGVLSIRNVTFMKSYQSPIEAGPNNFDFVIAFYHDNVLVSSSLINAYTVNRTRLQNIRADLVNYYHDNILTNAGNRLPTLLKISGHLTLQEAGTKIIKSMRLHLPFPLGFNNFLQTAKLGKIGCSTNNCNGFMGGLVNSKDSWASQNMIQIGSLPSLTQSFTILVPIVYQTPTKLSQVTVSFIQSDGQVGGVYRINGSCASQYLSATPNYIALPWTPVTAWTTTATQWVNQPTLYSYKQSIDLSAIVPFSLSNNINMGTTVMPATDTLPSTTFTSAYLNIFSDFSNPLVDNYTKCVNPFVYKYTNSYDVWVLWCPLRVGAVNQISFNYPLYPDSFGVNFPFSTVFSYAYADTAGKMIGYRVQTNATGGVAQTCITQKTTTYDKNSNNPQENEYIITVSPFQLNPAGYKKFLVTLTMPSLIPVTLISCRAVESSQGIALGCAKLSQASNVFKMELSYSGLTTIKVYQIMLALKTIKTSTATIITINPYSVSISLPFTDGAGLPTFGGVTYSPYSSLIASCSNSFTFSLVSSQQFIYLTEPKLWATSSSFYGAVEFQASFSNSRTTLFQSSQLVITFSQPILTPYSRCIFAPNTHFFSTSTVDASNKIMTLLVGRNFPDFTLTTYTVKCTQIISNGNNIMINMLWKDGIYSIQTTSVNVTAMHTSINSAVTTVTGTLVSKFYNAAGYRAQYVLRLALATTSTDTLQIWVQFPSNHVHSSFLECYHLQGTTWSQVMCIPRVKDVEDQVYLQFVGGTSADVQIKVYGIQQAKVTPTTIKVLLKKTNMNTGASLYYISNIADTLANAISSDPIQVMSYTIDSIPSVAVVYSMPVTYSSSFYIRIDELFRLQSVVALTCMINTTTVPCTRIRPDLILVSSTLTHGATYVNTLNISTLTYIYNEKYDTDYVHFGLFIASPTADTVLYGSHAHLQTMLLTSTLQPPLALVWEIPVNIFSQTCQIVYIGYYGPPAKLGTSSKVPFMQSFTYNYTSTLPNTLSMIDRAAQLGTNFEQAYIGTFDSTYFGYSTLQFTHDSSYPSMPALPIYISADKCTLTTQFAEYNIISGGRTIPIAINISACKPMDTLAVELVVNSPYMVADSALSTDFVYPSSDMIYVVVSHSIATVTVGQTYQLQILLKSNNSVVQNAYNAIKNVTIRIADRNLLIGNPQGKQPVINYITQNAASFAVQCNTPATIYWGIGLYPTMLGIRVEEIEARLIEKSNGLMQYSMDIYSWSQQIYGLDYVNDFNIDKNITVDRLEGGLQYVFKYFCIDQTGKASGGKISLINTLPSNYSLMKVTLGFFSILNFSQVNSVACAISQQLIIPYNQTISSEHSNCINNSQVYHEYNSTYFDENSTAAPHMYFFYVETNKITTRSITTILATSLGKNNIFMSAVLPYYTSMRVDSMLNIYQPIIYSLSLDIRKTQFTITVKVGLANTYLIAAIMNSHFDPATMSKPTHYLMKEGFFSLGKKFDQIISVYGRQSISGTFTNLAQGSAYSVFYFVTVDNSALNSRTSQVMYRDLVTNKYQYIDLNQLTLTVTLLMIFLIFWL